MCGASLGVAVSSAKGLHRFGGVGVCVCVSSRTVCRLAVFVCDRCVRVAEVRL